VGARLRRPQREASQSFEDAGATRARSQGQHGWIARLDGQEVANVGQDVAEVLAQRGDGLLDLVDDRFVGVAVLQAKGVLQQVDQRMKGDGSPEREAMSLVPGTVDATHGRVLRLGTFCASMRSS